MNDTDPVERDEAAEDINAGFMYTTVEGRELEWARRRIRPRLSVRKAAERAGMSDTRWRQIVRGYVSSGGVSSPVRAPAETVARMAAAVGVNPETVDEWGREDAATAMEDLGLAPPIIGMGQPGDQPVGLGLDAEAQGLDPDEVEAVRIMIRTIKGRKQ